MARTFTAASSQLLSVASTPVTAVPLTMACWFNPVSGTAAYAVFTISDGTTTNKFGLLQTVTTGTVGALVGASGNVIAVTSTTTTSGVWQHMCGVFSTSTLRAAFLNGAGKGTNTTIHTPLGLTSVTIGANPTGNFMNGSIAECAIWNIALTDAEVAIIGSNAFCPLNMHPESLVFYAPLLSPVTNPEPEIMGARTLTPSASAPTLAVHPRMFYSSLHRNPRTLIAPAAADTIFAQAIM